MRLLDNCTERLQRVLNNLPTGILELDAQGKCLLFNRATELILGLGTDDSLGRSIFDIVEEPAAKHMLVEAIEESKRNRPYRREIAIGGTFYDVCASVVDDGASSAPRFVVLLDDTSRKKEVQHQKDEFLALISHELRTPLTVIKGYVEILASGMMGEMTDKQLDCVNIVQDHCRQLETLIRDLIRFGMLSRGELKASPEAITVFPFLENLGQTLKEHLRKAQTRLSFVVPDPRITCLCDAEHLRDALRHLIDNAVKFSTAENGTIQICATAFDPRDIPPADERVIKSDPSPRKTWVKFEVVDNGPGIPRARLADIFNSFEQVEDYMTRKSRGMGLGLALVKEIVKVYRGSLWIESTEGSGTTVAFILPRIDRKDI